MRQYRNSLDAVDLEIPAGGYSFHGESGETCALREAEEETGWIPQDIYHVSNMISSVGTFDEKTDVYIGRNLKKGKRHLDPTEFIEIVRVPMEEAREMIYSVWMLKNMVRKLLIRRLKVRYQSFTCNKM